MIQVLFIETPDGYFSVLMKAECYIFGEIWLWYTIDAYLLMHMN